MTCKELFKPFNAGCGYEWATPIEWALKLPGKKRGIAFMKLLKLDKMIFIYIYMLRGYHGKK